MNLEFEKAITELDEKMAALPAQDRTPQQTAEFDKLQKAKEASLKEIYSALTPWQTVQVARHPERPLIQDFIAGLFSEFIELHGDRLFGDDHAIVGGFATLDTWRVMVIGHQKGRGIDDNLKFNFGMARPEGYRKAMRLMHMAEKFRVPVVCFIDTPGAYPGADAEERGQAEAIARNLMEMSALKTPIIVAVTGEGGSGGALGIGVGDVLLMMSNAVYSVISPEGCASILWRDGTKAPDAAAALKITAPALLKLKVIDEIVAEPLGGAHRDPKATIATLRKVLIRNLDRLTHTSTSKLLKRRFEKYARIGSY
jgi:acetyl-CoA carboxylase carboxyl transferase subunit alpha